MSLKYDYGNIFNDGSIKGFGEEFDSVAKADFMAAGVLEALKRSVTEGGAYQAGVVEPYGNMRFSHGENGFPNP